MVIIWLGQDFLFYVIEVYFYIEKINRATLSQTLILSKVTLLFKSEKTTKQDKVKSYVNVYTVLHVSLYILWDLEVRLSSTGVTLAITRESMKLILNFLNHIRKECYKLLSKFSCARIWKMFISFHYNFYTLRNIVNINMQQ